MLNGNADEKFWPLSRILKEEKTVDDEALKRQEKPAEAQ